MGATISQVPSGGFLENNGIIEGGGTISANIGNPGRNGGEMIAATNTTVPLVLQGYIEGDAETRTNRSFPSGRMLRWFLTARRWLAIRCKETAEF